MTEKEMRLFIEKNNIKFVNGMEIDTISTERNDEVQRLIVAEFVDDNKDDKETTLMVPTIELITIACKILGHLNPELLLDEVRDIFETKDEEIQEMKDNWLKYVKDNEQK